MVQYLLTPLHRLDQARAAGLPLGHMAFSLGSDGRLHHPPLPPDCQGGLMLLGAQEAPKAGADPERTVAQILRLCQARSFGGVVLDLECSPSPFLAQLIRGLEEGLFRNRRGLFLPERYAAYSSRAFLYLSSALSGGSLRRRLEEAVAQYGGDRLVLSLHRAREDFYLPAPEGKGRPLSQEELDRKLRQLDPRIHFSPELCAHYFTYMSRETGAHFVLFDDAESLAKKRALAQEAGIGCCFWLYPEVAELLPDLASRP